MLHFLLHFVFLITQMRFYFQSIVELYIVLQVLCFAVGKSVVAIAMCR